MVLGLRGVRPVLVLGTSRFSASVWAVVFVVASFTGATSSFAGGTMGGTMDEPASLTLEVVLPGALDRVELVPHDPRMPGLADEAPEAAAGLYVGTLAESGRSLHLVWTHEVALGVLDAVGGAIWVTVDAGTLVPFPAGSKVPAPGPMSDPVFSPMHDPHGAPLAATAARDGVLQLKLDADSAFHDATLGTWREMQLAVIHLVDAIYRASLGFSIEVVAQNTWTAADPEPYVSSGDCSNVVRSFRNYWEGESSTTSHVHEATHLFSGTGFAGTIIGCAFVGQLETAWAYGVSHVSGFLGNPLMNLYRNTVLVSHEVGHNFNGVHSLALGSSCAGGTIMYAQLCANSPMFSGAESLFLCQAGLVGECDLLQGGNAQRMWSYASPRI